MLPINTFNVHVIGVYFAKLVLYTTTQNMVPVSLKLRLNELQGFGNYQKKAPQKVLQSSLWYFCKETHLDLFNTTLTLRRDTHKPHRLSNNAAESKTSDHKNMVFRGFFSFLHHGITRMFTK